jgi:hypothetical protein
LNDELVLGCGRDEGQRWRMVLIVNALGLDFERMSTWRFLWDGLWRAL